MIYASYKLSAATVLIWPTLAMAAGGEHSAEHGETPGLLSPEPGLAIWMIVLFILLLGFLGKFVWPKILGGLQAREDKIAGDLDSAASANEKAQQVLAEYQQKIADAHAEARTLLDQTRADGEQMRQRLRSEAEQEIAQLRNRARDEISHAKTEAVQELYAQAGQLAVAVAEKILQRQIDEADTQSLVNESLKQMDNLDETG